MGMSKNLMIAMYPFVEDELEGLDDFLMESQADGFQIHQPAVVKSHNLEPF